MPNSVVVAMAVPDDMRALVQGGAREEGDVSFSESIEIETDEVGSGGMLSIHAVPIHEVSEESGPPIGGQSARSGGVEASQDGPTAVLGSVEGRSAGELGTKGGEGQDAIGHLGGPAEVGSVRSPGRGNDLQGPRGRSDPQEREPCEEASKRMRRPSSTSSSRCSWVHHLCALGTDPRELSGRTDRSTLRR